jgi:hypothetical protein
MSSDPVIDRLLGEHEQLRVIAAELTILLDRPEPPAADTLSDCRWRMARLMLRHLPVEDRQVFRRLDAHPEPRVRAKMADFRLDLDARYDTYRTHSEKWSVDCAIADWAAYRASARRQIVQLKEALLREESEIYPLLDGAPPAPAERPIDQRNWAGDAWLIRGQLGR